MQLYAAAGRRDHGLDPRRRRSWVIEPVECKPDNARRERGTSGDPRDDHSDIAAVATADVRRDLGGIDYA